MENQVMGQRNRKSGRSWNIEVTMVMPKFVGHFAFGTFSDLRNIA